MISKLILAASTALIITASAASAAEVAALTGDNTIAIVDTSQKKVVKTWNITGIAGKVLGIDVRPADGMLYALGADGAVYTVDTKTGKATQKSKLETMLPAGVKATVDFNPAADRLRVMGNDGTSLRVNVDDGKVTKDGSHKFADADMHKGEKPNVVAGAYSNSVKGTKETTLYNIDATIGALLRQAPPNDGVLNAIGKLGFKADSYAFDIWSDGQGKNDAWLMAGDTLYSVDLASGKATAVAKISGAKGPVRDIAILPAM
jgi:DNA-binding beta-propeller fold protein YncE